MLAPRSLSELIACVSRHRRELDGRITVRANGNSFGVHALGSDTMLVLSELPHRIVVRADDLLGAHPSAETIEQLMAAFQDGQEGWEESKGSLVYAKRLGDTYGFRVVVMIFPMLFRLSNDYPFVDIHRKLRAHLEENGVPVLDLLPAFQGHEGRELWVHPSNQHPNEVANRIAAEALYSFLVNGGFLETHPVASPR